jgi:hypothetical protein
VFLNNDIFLNNGVDGKLVAQKYRVSAVLTIYCTYFKAKVVKHYAHAACTYVITRLKKMSAKTNQTLLLIS